MHMNQQQDESFRNTIPTAGPAPQINIADAQQFSLTNGVKVILVQNPKLPLINIQLFIDNGKMPLEYPAGTGDITGELLSHGTQSLTKEAFDKAIDNLGANITTNAKGAYGNGLSKYAEQIFSLLSDAILHPALDTNELNKIIRQTYSTIESQKDSPESIARNIARTVNFGDKLPQGKILTTESLGAINIDKIRNYYQTTFDPASAYLIIEGDISLTEAERLSNKYFGSWNSTNYKKQTLAPAQPPQSLTVNIVDRPNAVQSLIMVTYPIQLRPDDKNILQANLMNDILGGYFSSRLNENLREKQGYTYGIRSQLSSDPDNGVFSISTSVSNAVTIPAIKEILSEMQILCTEKVSNTELEDVKNVITGEFARSLENPKVLAQFALDISRFNLPENYYKNYIKSIQAITPEEILSAAKRYLHPKAANIIIVGNKKEISAELTNFVSKEAIRYYSFDAKPLNFISTENPQSAQLIIHKYLEKINALDKFDSIRTSQRKYSFTLNETNFTGYNYFQYPDKFYLLMEMNGKPIQKTIIKDNKGSTTINGNTQDLSADEIRELTEASSIIDELLYTGTKAQLTYLGQDTLGGEQVHKIEVVFPDKLTKHEYYRVNTALKVKSEIFNQNGNTETVYYSDYKDYNGILFPSIQKVSGRVPEPITIHNSSFQINEPIDPTLFE